MPPLREAAEVSKAWPFEEARKLIARLEHAPKAEVIFETGYGPSGLPHIGTFGEVARTTMVRHAFRVLTGDAVKTRLIAFSDDMDGLRKTPDNIPNRELVAAHLGKPLTRVPDPFGQYESFAAHNNAMLRRFLDRFGFDYEFMSSTEAYKSGRFDAALIAMLARFDEVQAIMLPSLREERAATYSPFLPIHPRTGVVVQAPVLSHDASAGTIRWRDPDTNEEFETPVTGGQCKLQWKPDWAMRWHALGVDYEMAGKDLIDSVKLSSRIVRVLGSEPPAGFNYELFLDENGQKISKSKGNGLTIEEWLTYASPESLSLFMFQKPMAAKRLYFDVIPRTVDDYLGFLETYPRQEWKERLGNPVWHVHSGEPPAPEALTHGEGGQTSVSFAMLLNLAAVANSDNPAVLWGFLRRYAPSASPKTIRGSIALCATRSPISATSSRRRSAIASPTKSSARRSAKSPRRLRDCRPAPARKRSSTRFTTSPGPFPATRTCPRRARRPRGRAFPTTSSTWSMRCCSARTAARASARSSRSTDLRRRAP